MRYRFDKDSTRELLRTNNKHEEGDTLLRSGKDEIVEQIIQVQQNRAQRWALFYLSLGIFTLSLTFLVLTWSRQPGEIECAKLLSPYCESILLRLLSNVT